MPQLAKFAMYYAKNLENIVDKIKEDLEWIKKLESLLQNLV